MYVLRVYVALTIAFFGLWVSGLYVLRYCRRLCILVTYSFVFNMQIPSRLSHVLMAIDWLFLRLFNVDLSCNVSFTIVFPTVGVDGGEVLFSARENLIKLGLSQGGGVQMDFPLKGWEGLAWMLMQKKYCDSMRVLNLFQFLYLLFKRFRGGVNKG